MTKRITPLLLVVVLQAEGCGLFEPHVESCGDDCPNIGASGSGGAGQGGASSASQSGAGATGGAAGKAGSGIDGGSGSGASGAGGSAPDSGSGGSMQSTDGGPEAGPAGTGGDAGDAGSSGSGGACEACPSDTPHCQDNACVECTDDDHCPDGVCEQNACVPCRTDDDCHDVAAARCSNQHQCVPCVTSGDCQHLLDTQLCNAGTCVQCTGTDYNDCGLNASAVPRVCNSLTNTCTTELEHSAGLCDPCVSDAQCKPGQLCVMQTYDDPTDTPDGGELEVGYFCFWREDSTEANAPAGDCTNVRPYFSTQNATSIDGVQATVCGLRVTTCAGYKDFSSQACTGTDDDDACGDPRFADGYCEQASSSTYRCTTPCLSDDDCKTGSTCNTSVTPNYCNLQ